MGLVNAEECLSVSISLETIRTAFFWDRRDRLISLYLAEKLRFGQGSLLRNYEYICRFIGNSRLTMLWFLNFT